MELGVFSLSDIYPDSPDTAASRIDDIISYGILAEQHGLDVYGIGEHHTRQFAVSSPAVVHAAIARATQRIKLTTTASVLSVLDPVRVYQDFATLDLVSHGRAEIIAGRSAFAEPFALFGEDIAQLDDLFAEKLDLLLRLREQKPLTWEGRFRPPLHEAEVNPPAHGDLPVWVAVGGTPSSALRAGRLGLPMALGLIGGTIDHAKRLIDLYRSAGREAGHPAERLTVGITSHFYVGQSQEQALEEFYPYYHRYLSPETNGGRGFYVDRPTMQAMASRRGALIVGGPREVSEKILEMRSVLGIDRFLGQVDLGGMPQQMVRDSIQRFGDDVAPAVRHVLAT
ncbi:Flavin-dependent oxidoreductase, luciferase family (includes alkanesulfonate monooxygenase SsuD and methylene tetrahydromethanopterin reductase) [Promicromonospora umidemergens]|uniref:LLM class flavin-dependent oxidoreductase n=1 Tax=Promicromonospora umidemergens TaxID=629679 RepID=A0ABP8Y6R8_9MICO|nr:LLM class flavin-dependent oxidoreductase [Promicromonospora umidemergens]MCP2282751.1 Flavin-dependent oxidoreductase, luciferase family (includes alkanesulfonate monooxygenase SsuD and methylene tetrahydromethanopterin reductase) [Promicromonospora umidemergens]